MLSRACHVCMYADLPTLRVAHTDCLLLLALLPLGVLRTVYHCLCTAPTCGIIVKKLIYIICTHLYLPMCICIYLYLSWSICIYLTAECLCVNVHKWYCINHIYSYLFSGHFFSPHDHFCAGRDAERQDGWDVATPPRRGIPSRRCDRIGHAVVHCCAALCCAARLACLRSRDLKPRSDYERSIYHTKHLFSTKRGGIKSVSHLDGNIRTV